MEFNIPLAQQNYDFYGYTVFTLSFNDVPIRFVTEKDALNILKKRIIEIKKENVSEQITFLKYIDMKNNNQEIREIINNKINELAGEELLGGGENEST